MVKIINYFESQSGVSIANRLMFYNILAAYLPNSAQNVQQVL